jgi:hypothetical protein
LHHCGEQPAANDGKTGASFMGLSGKSKVKFTQKQATTAQRGSKGIALLFL